MRIFYFRTGLYWFWRNDLFS